MTMLTVDNDDAHIEGKTQGSVTTAQVEKALNDVARAKSVAKAPPQGSDSLKGIPFSFNFKINRKP